MNSERSDLIRRIERDEVRGLAGYGERFASIHGAEGRGVLRKGGWAVVVLGEGLPINRAIGIGNEAGPTLTEIEDAERFMRAFGMAPEFETTDLTAAELTRLLEPRDYVRHKDFTWYVKSTSGSKREIPPHVQIDDDPNLDVWIAVNARGFDGLDAGEASKINTMLSATTARSEAGCFTAWIDGEPAGSGAMAIQDGHAMLFSTSTLPKFRRRGVQTALLEYRAQRARAAGCDLLSVKVEPGSDSERNIARNGFEALCAKTAWKGPETP